MSALVFHEVKQPLKLEKRDTPEPESGQAVVQLHAAALNRRDYWITQGLYPGIKTPVVLGSDGAGVVAHVGEGVDRQWVGREVILYPGFDWGDDEAAQSRSFHVLGMPSDGTFADHVVVPAENLVAKPEHLNLREAAALPLAGLTAYRAVFTQGELRRGQRVLVTGIGGGVATFALQYAVALGCQTWVTSSSPAKIDAARELGAIDGFNYRQDDWANKARAEIGGVDLVIDGAGGSGYTALTDLLNPGGRIVNYGATAGPPKLDLFKVFWKQLRIVGSTMGSPKDMTAMLQFIESHRIKPIISHTFSLAMGNRALELMGKANHCGKIVLTIGE